MHSASTSRTYLRLGPLESLSRVRVHRQILITPLASSTSTVAHGSVGAFYLEGPGSSLEWDSYFFGAFCSQRDLLKRLRCQKYSICCSLKGPKSLLALKREKVIYSKTRRIMPPKKRAPLTPRGAAAKRVEIEIH